MSQKVLFLLLLSFFTICFPVFSDEANDRAGIAFFEKKIRPVLVNHCYQCHSVDAGAAEGGLRLDDRTAIRSGGTQGPGVVPGRPEASLLYLALSHADSNLEMPPGEPRLSKTILHDFRRWIEMGAPDPRESNLETKSERWPTLEEAKSFWAFQAPQATALPEIQNATWPRDELDHFIHARFAEHQLEPSPDAEPRGLLRRLSFDLIGLPPSPQELNRFLKACEKSGLDTALEAEVDRLLASPRFGERWGRHWLDVARFGESSGNEANIPFPYAWRYRDYVIDAVNEDLPIDRFLTEQIAGDLLPSSSNRERARLLVATGFLAVGTKNLAEANDLQFQADLVDEQIDTLSRAVMGSSLACARCHDHKFDPFTMQDYYALAGIFHSTKTYFGTFVSPASQQGGDLLQLPRVEGDVVLHSSVSSKRAQEMREQLAALREEMAEIQDSQKALFAGKEPEKTFTLREVLANIWRTGPLEGKLQTIDNEGQAIPVAMGTMDQESIVNAPLLRRGQINHPGERVPRAFPQVLRTAGSPPLPKEQSGRLELAQWLTNPEHPLTGRVFVNRVWHHLFGAGLVSTVDNFGTSGELPSHPRLLDTLTVQFQQDGWSLKRLIRRLVLSRTYRQASTFRQAAFLVDPENRFLWRMPKQRLEAEAIRDAMLFVSGELETSRPTGSLVGTRILDKPISLIGLDAKLPDDLDGALTRSVYLPVIRDRLPDVLDLFDFAEPSLVTGHRDTTNVPLQALYLLNSSFVQDRAKGLATRLAKEAPDSEAQVLLAFELCFSRLPTDDELDRSLSFLEAVPTEESTAPTSDATDQLTSFAQALLSTAEFRNLD
ncbi:Secreted protein containing planctomycete cytochrome C domain [Planctomycetales bacterium 10988]|nr:Secreted protein containing planctomycete cytochrome C domain [Planctomycetales bacterium 10988]